MKNKNKKCAVSMCPSPSGVTYFSFPKDRQEIWLNKCMISDFKKLNMKNVSICESHFSEDCFIRDFQNELMGLPVRRLLSSSAVPSLYLPYEEPPSQSDRELELRRKGQEELVKQKEYIASLDLENDSEVSLQAGEPNFQDDKTTETGGEDKETQCSIDMGYLKVFPYFFVFKAIHVIYAFLFKIGLYI